MWRKQDHQTESGRDLSPEAYRALVKTIKVTGGFKRRTLEEVLAEPPRLPKLIIPGEREEPVVKRKAKVAGGRR